MKVIEYKQINKGSLLGSMSILMDEWGGLVIREVLLFQKDGKRWLNFPSKTYEKDGKTEYFYYLRFSDKIKHEEWQQKALKALQDYVNEVRATQGSEKPPETHQGKLNGIHFVPPSENNLTPHQQELPF